MGVWYGSMLGLAALEIRDLVRGIAYWWLKRC